MSQQTTVKISDQLTALITYHFPLPVKYHGGYIIENGNQMSIKDNEDAGKYFEQLHKENIAIPAKISNVLLLQSEYKRQALQLYGTDLAAIQKAVNDIPMMEFETPKALQDYCTIYDY